MMNFNLLQYPQFVAIMKDNKNQTLHELVPHGKWSKARFCGYRITCKGFIVDPVDRYLLSRNRGEGFPVVDYGGCYFKLPETKKITEKMFREVKDHFMENPSHEMKCNVDFEYSVSVD